MLYIYSTYSYVHITYYIFLLICSTSLNTITIVVATVSRSCDRSRSSILCTTVLTLYVGVLCIMYMMNVCAAATTSTKYTSSSSTMY